jgi:hypothetical protein
MSPLKLKGRAAAIVVFSFNIFFHVCIVNKPQ